MNQRFDFSGKQVWVTGAGQGIGAVKSIEPVADLVDRLANEYEEAKKRICGKA